MWVVFGSLFNPQQRQSRRRIIMKGVITDVSFAKRAKSGEVYYSLQVTPQDAVQAVIYGKEPPQVGDTVYYHHRFPALIDGVIPAGQPEPEKTKCAKAK